MDIGNKYGTLAYQQKLLDLIKRFDQFCTDHAICYSLNDGSLLGAVRHNGFIPWDDDLDIIVDRSNLNKLRQVKDFSAYGIALEREYWIDKVRSTTGNDANGYQPTIDVFVLDRAPQTKIHQTLKTLLIRSLQGMMKPQPHYAQYSWKNKILSFALYLLGRLLPADFKFWLYQKISMSYGGSQSPYSSCYNEPFHDVGILHKAHVLDSLERHPFEDTELTIMRGYHDYLTDMFGDYMTPPPVQDRKPIHMS